MENSTKLGMNRTGFQMAPIEGPLQEEFAMQVPPTSAGSIEQAAAVRTAYIAEADRIGSVPPPGTMKGMLTTAADKLTGSRPEVLLDKLGQRLAFERTGVRLYQALCTKVQAAGHFRLDELYADLVRIAEDEARHFDLLCTAVESLGADPTAQTPCADVSGVASLGLLQVITDPRTTVAQSLDAILTVELTDNAAWELLIALARESGHDDMAESFVSAYEQEEEHLITIKGWLRATVMHEAV